MSDLYFSAEAHHAAAIVFRDRGLVPPFLPEVLDAALVHDAERLAREIIEQRVMRLTTATINELEDERQDAFNWAEDGDARFRDILLRALTEQP